LAVGQLGLLKLSHPAVSASVDRESRKTDCGCIWFSRAVAPGLQDHRDATAWEALQDGLRFRVEFDPLAVNDRLKGM